MASNASLLRYHFPVKHRIVALAVVLACGLGLGAQAASEHLPTTPRKMGVKTPGVQIPMARLKPDAIFPLPGAPDWMVIDDSVWISNRPKDSLTRIDPKTNKIIDTIAVGKGPCAGLALGFGSVWTPNCGDQTVARVDLKTGKVTAAIPTGIADSEATIAASADSIWLLTDTKGTLARFDPATNLVVETIPVGPAPRFLATGEGSVWTLNQGDGTVSRIDPKTNKVVATIEVGVPGGGGDSVVGEGSVWVTSFEFPLSRIDPATNKVVQQFAGPGGDAVRVGQGSVWLTDLKGQKIWRLDPRRIEATV